MPKCNDSIKCTVTSCVHLNDREYFCTLDQVSIGSRRSRDCHSILDVNCESFEEK